MPRRLDMLKRHHERLLEIVATARPLITGSARNANLDGLRHLREEVVEALSAYQRYVHRDVFEPAALAGDVDALQRARVLKIECTELDRAY